MQPDNSQDYQSDAVEKSNVIEPTHALRLIEAVLYASETPVSLLMLRQVFEGEYDEQLNTAANKKNVSEQPATPKITNAQIESWLNQLSAKLLDSALELIKTASGYRIQVRAEYAPVVARLWPERPTRLSQALLETLSVIAYRQPVTRADIEQLRGVTVNSQILRTLFERQWIAEDGFRPVAGKPALIVTTRHFLDAFGLQSLDHLPPLKDLESSLNDLGNQVLQQQGQ